MGNVFHKLFSSKKNDNLNGNSKKSRSRMVSDSAVSEPRMSPIHDNNNEVEGKPVSREIIITNEHFLPSQSNANHDESIETTRNEPEEDTSKSPFQRDFYPPAHEILVPLEKHRPRRSNVRRSTRTNQTDKSRSNSAGDVHESPLATNDLRYPATQTRSTSPESNDGEPPVDYDEAKQLPPDDNLLVDQLEPSERTKVARSRISEMFLRRQVAGQSNYRSFIDNNHESDVLDEIEVVEMDCAQTEVKQIDDGFVDESQLPEEVILRPKPPARVQGNRLLIDELKKRQSTIMFDRESSLVK